MWEETPLSLDFLWYEVEIPEYIDIYTVESDDINAFASLWGKVIFTTGILKSFQSKEEFLFVLWHEIDHIKQRDVLKWLSLQLPITMSLLFLWIDIGIQNNIFYSLGSSYFSRQTELRADIAGIEFVKNHQKNPYCIIPFFENDDDIFSNYLAFHSTHPSNQDRIAQIKKLSPENTADCENFVFP